MTLTRKTRNLLPEDIEREILLYLSVTELSTARNVSVSWSKILSDASLWEEAFTKEPSKKIKLQQSLITAVQSNQFNQVRHYINIGTEVDFRIAGVVDRNFSLGDPTVGYFENPTLLSLAANSVSKKDGSKIIFLLLINGANILQNSDYHEFSSSAMGGMGLGSVNESIGFGRPVKFALDNGIKTILYLAEFEDALKNFQPSDHINTVLFFLDAAYDEDCDLTQEYVNQLMQAQDTFSGVQSELKKEDIDKIRHVKMHPPGFFEKYWLWILGASYIETFFSVCFAKTLGTSLIGLFAMTVAPAAITISMGVAAIGLMTAGLFFLVKKAKDYLNQSKKIHFPIVLDDDKPSGFQSTYSKSLFPQLGCSREPRKVSIVKKKQEQSVSTSSLLLSGNASNPVPAIEHRPVTPKNFCP